MSRGGREDLGLLDLGVPRLGAQPLCLGGKGFPGPALNELVGIIRGGQAALGVLPPPIGNYLAELPKKPPSKRLWTWIAFLLVCLGKLCSMLSYLRCGQAKL